MSVRTQSREFQCDFCQRAVVVVGAKESPCDWEKFQRKRDDTTYVVDLCRECIEIVRVGNLGMDEDGEPKPPRYNLPVITTADAVAKEEEQLHKGLEDPKLCPPPLPPHRPPHTPASKGWTGK